jgi:hypothetical protein
MRRAYYALLLTLFAAVTLAVTAAAQQPRITNAKLTAQPAGSPFVQSFQSLVSAQSDIAWIAYRVPVWDRQRVMCCFWSGSSYISGSIVMSDSSGLNATACGLEPSDGARTTRPRTASPSQSPVKLEGSEHMAVLFRVAERRVERIRMFSEECELDAGGRPVIWLENVKPADSLALLESLIGPETERKDRVTGGAVSVLAMHAEPSAGSVLERLARRHASTTVRGEALFWMAQRSDRNAEQVIVEALDKDESSAVRKKAVFALSQMKDDRGIDALIRVARSDRETSVRGEAIFWLAQKAGAKASALITERIENDPDTEVKKRAVFALSQLPKDEGVPLLIKVARTHANPAVRKQAMFWLGQSKDPRALEFFAEILR